MRFLILPLFLAGHLAYAAAEPPSSCEPSLWQTLTATGHRLSAWADRQSRRVATPLTVPALGVLKRAGVRGSARARAWYNALKLENVYWADPKAVIYPDSPGAAVIRELVPADLKYWTAVATGRGFGYFSARGDFVEAPARHFVVFRGHYPVEGVPPVPR